MREEVGMRTNCEGMREGKTGCAGDDDGGGGGSDVQIGNPPKW